MEALKTAPAVADAHSQDVRAVTAALEVEPARGLDQARVAERRARYGENRLPEAEPIPLWRKFLAQFNQLVVWILIVAAIIAGATGDLIDTAAILAIVLLNGILGLVQEERAEQALESLRKLSIPTARVRREGRVQSLPAAELVPGDVVYLEAGDSVPADARLVESFGLTAQEAALTGESVPSEKEAGTVVASGAAIGDRANMVYFGTSIAAGKATALVTATGPATELGHIAGMLAREEREPTPLQRRLEWLGRVLVVVCLAIVGLIAALLWARGLPMSEILLPSISLAVAAVPEGLPAVVTIALALGLRRLVKRNALVRKLPSVETLGSVTVICSDKTGTLTRNEMTVREIAAGDAAYEVSGTGYEPKGEIRARAGSGDRPAADGPANDAPSGGAAREADGDLAALLTCGVFSNNARLVEKEGRYGILGDPTEGALLVVARKGGVEIDQDAHRLEYEIPFDSTRKTMSKVFRFDDGRRTMFVKGAPEEVLVRATRVRIDGDARPLDDARRRAILKQNEEMAGRALRVLGLAQAADPPADAEVGDETELVFLGLVGMIDPPRDEVRDAVAKCRQAGIRPVMITGDHPATAAAIARELGIADEHASETLIGVEIDKLDDDELDRRVERTAVYARVSAEHKLRVVRSWKRRGQITAMTGDGVNDAPAVKAADIGIAMGITGTDVTQSASDMVLTDDNFASIVNAVEEGRGILDNIRKVIHYLLACNAGEVLLMFFAAALGLPVPLSALMILWINLVTDGFPALALAVEQPEENLMRRKPRRPDAALISRTQGLVILGHGLSIALTALAAFWLALRHFPGDLEAARALTFAVTAFAQLFFALGCRSERVTLWRLGLFTNRPLLYAVGLSAILQLGAVAVAIRGEFDRLAGDYFGWLVGGTLALTPLVVFEIGKALRRGPQLRRGDDRLAARGDRL